MSDNRQRKANGERSKTTFATDITRELDRLEAEIVRQEQARVPRRIKVTLKSVAEAAGHHRTTFNGAYHQVLRDRIKALAARASDPKPARVPDTVSAMPAKKIAVSVDRGESKKFYAAELDRINNENRLLRRKAFELEKQMRLNSNGSSPFIWKLPAGSVKAAYEFGSLPLSVEAGYKAPSGK